MMKKDTLDRVYLKKPCSTEWNLMEGNDQIRFCSECNKQVYNLSSMTRKQAEDLLAKGGGELCAKIDRDDRGKIITAYQLNDPSFFRMRLPSFTSAAVATLLGIGVTVQAEVPSPLYGIVSVSSAQSPKQSTEKTQTRDGKSAIVGTVFDITKAVIVGAKVTLINEKSNQEHTVATSEEGQYRLEKIAPGTYTIKIESRGFISFKKKGIELRADKQLRVDVTLQVGTVGGLAILPDNDKSRPISKVLSSPIRAIKRALGVNS
jgi:hypothetical protein